MRERPILFSGPMVRAILDGRKSQTRRVVTPQPVTEGDGWYADWYDHSDRMAFWNGCKMSEPRTWLCLHGQPGDRLWVRETWQVWHEFDKVSISALHRDDDLRVNYPADGNIWDAKKRPSIHMPRWVSRLTLEITDVRVERVQDISEGDARAEGVNLTNNHGGARNEFRSLWDSINATRGYDWNTNPWVWVITFHHGEDRT